MARFESIDNIYNRLIIMGHDYQFSYNGGEYFLSRYSVKGKKIFTIAENYQNDDPLEFNTFDELLDNYKADNGKPAREFLLEADIEYEF